MTETYFYHNTNSMALGENLTASQLQPPDEEFPPPPFEIPLVLDPLGDFLTEEENLSQPPEPLSQQNTVSLAELDPLTGEEVHRFWDEQTQGHFFTASSSEFSDRQSNPARYRYEGVEFEVPSPTDSQALPVYRFLNQSTGSYFYTLQDPDVITGEFPVLESDGIAFYAFSPSGAVPLGAIPVYRFFNESASASSGSPVHFFTGSEENKDNVIANLPSFTFEGVGWYALDPDGIATTQGGGSTQTSGGSTTSEVTIELGGGSSSGGGITLPEGLTFPGGITLPGRSSSSSGDSEDFVLDNSFGGEDFGSGF